MDMEQRDYDPRTALHVAAAEGHAEVVRFLLEPCKVNPVPMDRERREPAERGERKECLLLQRRGRTFRKGEEGDTPPLGNGRHGSALEQPPSTWSTHNNNFKPCLHLYTITCLSIMCGNTWEQMNKT
uniref:Uncharacterized protein n=1 Tax=Hucho hucho TaxID=62062 RepID=A0A4W5NRG8_9TELE